MEEGELKGWDQAVMDRPLVDELPPVDELPAECSWEL